MIEINKKNARIWSMMGARGAFGEAIAQLADERNDFLVLSADLSRASGLDKFKMKHPEQFVNVGIAEQNLVGIASGIAKENTKVFTTSYAPFITMRCCEQVRMNCYMNLDVVTVGLSAGLEQGYFGNSHYGIEDAGVMRCIPNMTVVSPADGVEIVKTVIAALDYHKPLYIRLTGTNNLPIVYVKDYDFEIGKAVVLKEGEDIALIAAGTMVSQAIKAAKKLEEYGLSVAVINMHTIKPIDGTIVAEYAQKVKLMVTIEEHSILGGLGTAVAEELSSLTNHARLIRLGMPDQFEIAGNYEFMLKKFGLVADKIAERIIQTFK